MGPDPGLSRMVIVACPAVADRIAGEGFAGEMLDRVAATVVERARALKEMLESEHKDKKSVIAKAI